MFQSSSSLPCYAFPTLLPEVCSTAAAPQAMHDAGGTHPTLFSSSPQYPSPFPSRYHHGSSSTYSLSPYHGMPVPSNPPPFFFPPPPSSSLLLLSPISVSFSSLLSPLESLPLPPRYSSPLQPVTLLLLPHDHPQQPFFSSSGDNLDFCAGPGPSRLVFRSDLQNGMQASGNNYNQEGTAIPGRVGRYGPDERQQKIKRYRSNRNKRNFNKKITYPCRKTLADSRPRVRGRFARNGETQTERKPQVEAEVKENNYNNCEQALTSGGGGTIGNGDLLRQIETALMTEDVDSGDPLWAGFDDTFDKNPSEDFFKDDFIADLDLGLNI